ncbi:ATP-binding cassette domain-containing protein [Xanthobacteraceae bacterium Astr-EGSB]|uniref:ATP-binding cassette domain-containing protein n=1 Tax=Astrobacterium formosum TaxID=3069710 RepID=UPI0027B32FC3|nr:ATP-binding cassette domain-containing protein [Xanthobacteraceae bacterium Astr-EGSB]
MSGASHFVEVRNLSRRFDVSKPWLNRLIEGGGRRYVEAVRDVSFDVDKGETFALVGESGSGKSTVARMLVGLMSPDRGSVTIDGTSITGEASRSEQRALRRRMQMIFQDPYASLNPRWRVGRIIAEPMLALKVVPSSADAASETARLLTLVGMSAGDMRRYPHEFSGGQRQRIAIARALAARAEFIVCDEPTSALDVSVQAQILNLMRDLQQELGLTYVLISHNLAVVRHMAGRIGVMHAGRLVEVQPARQLFVSPQHDYTRMLIGSVPQMSSAMRRASSTRGAPCP